jgi:hypothetical protein
MLYLRIVERNPSDMVLTRHWCWFSCSHLANVHLYLPEHTYFVKKL